MDIDKLLTTTVERGASDLHITVGLPPMLRLHGSLIPIDGEDVLKPDDTQKLAYSILNDEERKHFEETSDIDLSYQIKDVGRFRVNMFRQKERVGIVSRVIPVQIPSVESIGVPQAIVDLTKYKNGLVLVTGPTGSGKSTTLASMINHINLSMDKHILTIEDPIEFSYDHGKSIINQREVGVDTQSFGSALRAALREDPDVILVGEMRDLETIAKTLEIAETGHLAFATLHTVDVAQTIDRIIDVFPPHQQEQIRNMLSLVIRGIVCQQLLPTVDGKGRCAAREILIADDAVKNLIREGQTAQIYSRLQTGKSLGMCTLDSSIQELLKEGKITKEVAEDYAVRGLDF